MSESTYLFVTDTFEVPAVPARRIVARPRLNTLLDEVLNHPVTVVHAPAGCGKTIAVAGWCARRKVCAAWVRLDAADVAEARFIHHLCATADYVLGEHNPPAPVAQAEHADSEPWYINEPQVQEFGLISAQPENAAPSAEAFALLDGWLARLAGASGPVVIVVDNWHVLQQSARASLYMRWVVQRLPQQVHLVLLGRVFPQVGAARLGLSEDVLEIGLQQLMFTRLETAAFCQMEGFQPTEDALDEICAALAGWPAALALYSKALQAADVAHTPTPDVTPDAVWRAFDRAAYEYLYDEMLIHMPDALQTFTTVVACFDEFSDAMAAHVLQWSVDEVDRCIAALIDYAALSAGEVDAQGDVCYAVAPVVRRALYGRGVVRTRYRYKDIMACAAAWYEEHANFDQAVRGYAAARQYDDAAQVVYRHWRSAFAEDNLAALARWVHLLPENYSESHPKFCIISALPIMVEGNREGAFERLRWAGLALTADDDELAGLYHAVRALCLSFVDVKASCPEARRALETLAAGEDHLRSMMWQVLASAQAYAQPAEACEGYFAARDQLAGTGLRNPLCSVYANLAFISAGAGRVPAALEQADAACGLYSAEEQGERAMLVSAYAARAYAYYLAGDDAYMQVAQFAWQRIQTNDLPSVRAMLQVLFALHARAAGDEQAELSAARNAFAASYEWSLRLLPSVTVFGDWLRAGVFSPDEAARALEPYAESDIARLIEVSMHFEQGECTPDAASAAQSLGTAFAEFPLARVRAGVLAAAMYNQLGNTEQAQAALADAFAAAEPAGVRAPFLADAQAVMATWEACARFSKDGFAARLLRDVPTAAPQRPTSDIVALLSERELEVVRLAAQGMNNQQVAQRLFVSRETAKKHLANVYTKLGVHTRTQAAAVLRQAGLL